jgi:hypothetical protein
MMRTQLESWQTSRAAPFLTIDAGGLLEGVVTINSVAGGRGRSRVEASWTQDGRRCSQFAGAANL